MTGFPSPPEALPAPVVDSHCHLDIVEGFVEGEPLSPGDALAAAAAVGITRVVQIGCDVASSRWAADCADEFDQVVAAVALHPNEAPRLTGPGELDRALNSLEELTGRPRVRAIGETGLDFFRTEPAGLRAQEESFRAHIDLAKRTGKALVVHDREAHADVLRVLDDEGHPDVVVMHCFSGDAEFAREVVERGWYCSFAGVVTFKNAQALRDALEVVPDDRVLVETDAPFLTPAPHRGKPNASFLIPHTVRAMAEVRDAELADLCNLLWSNAMTAFGQW